MSLIVYLRALWHSIKWQCRIWLYGEPDLEEGLLEDLEKKTRWRDKYENGEITKQEMRRRYEEEGFGWFDCESCGWDGAHVPCDLNSDDEESTMELYCPGCDSIIDSI